MGWVTYEVYAAQKWQKGHNWHWSFVIYTLLSCVSSMYLTYVHSTKIMGMEFEIKQFFNKNMNNISKISPVLHRQ